jgi:glycosyltransferase involved in cell wall biosynthesis
MRRGWPLLANGQFRILFDKAKRYLGGRPQAALANAKIIRGMLTPGELRCSVLIIDHELGGGANQYRKRIVAEKVTEGATVFILSFHVATLSYVLTIQNKRLNERFWISGYAFLVEVAKTVDLKEIIYNTGVSFTRPDELPQLLVKLKNQFNSRLTLLLHDFFMVCPSHFLLDSNGAFCNIPELEKCRTCLPSNQQGFAPLFPSQNIAQWRFLWGNALSLADEIRAFSNDTLDLLKKAYPALDLSRAIVKPHDVKYLGSGKINPSFTAKLKIGVVGQIGLHKGAKFIQELAKEIKSRDLDIQIMIIGAIEASCVKSVVKQTGPYQQEQLRTLIEGSEANIMLFSSIWPETFSYVVQELIALNLPIACFNLGAPAERLASYSKGLILNRQEASSVLDELIAFHQRMYLLN